MSAVIELGDLFAGSGGTSTGALMAIKARGKTARLVAVNHWPVAVATHEANHPEHRHYCMDLETADPETMVPGRRLDLLVASPECVFFSRARGGKPVNDQRRAGADWVLRWLERLDVNAVLIENVEEFTGWGDVNEKGAPIKSKNGRFFLRWLKQLTRLGYRYSWKVLNAADYGDATTRKRFFLIARKDGRPIRWPTPTHSKNGTSDMFGTLPKWRAAREIIDWSDLGPSLLDRPKPLSLKTRLRIARGLQRFGGVLAPLYIRLLDLPAEDEQRFVAGCTGQVAQTFLAVYQQNAVPRSTDEPLPTLLTEDHVSLVSPTTKPFLIGQQSDSAARSVEHPTMTISTGGVLRLTTPTVSPFVDVYYQTGVADSVDEPLSTATTKPRHALVSPLVVPYGPRADARSTDDPLPTVMTKDRLGVATPLAAFLTPNFGEAEGQLPRVHAIDDALPTVAAQGHMHLATATLDAAAQAVDPRRLVIVDGQLLVLDIRFRMLKNSELAAAMGFPPDYQFTGTKTDVTRQIGNAVPVNTAAALVGAILDDGVTPASEAA